MWPFSRTDRSVRRNGKPPRVRLEAEALESREVPAFLNPVTSPHTVGQIATGDFNNDHIADQASVVSGTIRIGYPTTYPRGGIYYTTYYTTTLKVQLGNGDGTYRSGANIALAMTPYPGSQPITRLAVGDFNEDGNLDILCSLTAKSTTFSLAPATYTTAIRLYAGRGDGTLQSGATVTTLAGGAAASVGDVNGDGHLDFWLSGVMNLYFGNGNGTFRNVKPPSGGLSIAADFNGDGRADLAALDSAAGTVTVSLGTAEGTYQFAQTIGIGTNPTNVAAVDIDGDGLLDLAVIAANGLSVLRNDGNW